MKRIQVIAGLLSLPLIGVGLAGYPGGAGGESAALDSSPAGGVAAAAPNPERLVVPSVHSATGVGTESAASDISEETGACVGIEEDDPRAANNGLISFVCVWTEARAWVWLDSSGNPECKFDENSLGVIKFKCKYEMLELVGGSSEVFSSGSVEGLSHHHGHKSCTWPENGAWTCEDSFTEPPHFAPVGEPCAGLTGTAMTQPPLFVVSSSAEAVCENEPVIADAYPGWKGDIS